MTRADVTFELEGLELEGDELVVSGHWSGVRGLRFVRPTLLAEDRRILATLEHKPWAPSRDRAWTAAFPWTGGDPDARNLTLAVAPQVSLRLAGADDEPVLAAVGAAPRAATATNGRRAAPAEPVPAAPAAPAKPAAPRPARKQAARIASLESELAGVTRERDELRERLEAAERRLRDAERRPDDHEAALARTQADRDEAFAQRDEVLLALRALERRMRSELAREDRSRNGDGPSPQAPGDEPLGVRRMPAARTVMAELQRAGPAPRLALSRFDLWVMRVLGTVAAGCFILLLVSILRVVA